MFYFIYRTNAHNFPSFPLFASSHIVAERRLAVDGRRRLRWRTSVLARSRRDRHARVLARLRRSLFAVDAERVMLPRRRHVEHRIERHRFEMAAAALRPTTNDDDDDGNDDDRTQNDGADDDADQDRRAQRRVNIARRDNGRRGRRGGRRRVVVDRRRCGRCCGC